MSGPHTVENASGGDPAERLWQQWQQGQRPDVDAFLAQAGPLSPDEVAAVLRVDQRQRWQAGERVLAESYLERHPEVRADPEPAIDLVFNEFLLRVGRGERPDKEDYLRRFPEYADILREQIALHQAIEGGPSALAGPTAPGPGPTLTAVGERRPDQERRSSGALVLPVGPQSSNDVQTLLRKRLLFLPGGFWVACSISALGFRQLFVREPYLSWLLGLMLALTGGLAVLLWSGRRLSLRQLRWLEVGFIAALAALGTWRECRYFPYVLLSQVPAGDTFGARLLAQGLCFQWFALVVIYGLLIPNTWRRCVAVVGVLTLWAVLLNTALVLQQATTVMVPSVLMECAIRMGVGAALAVYGAHRIEVLRVQAIEARRLGPYQLKRRLGAGGMGEVYLAEHVLLLRPCAVKLIRPERAGDPISLRRFEREVQAMATLTHPNTVEVYDYGHTADGTCYYAMEYLPGLDLEHLVNRHGPVSPGRAVHLLRQVCGALAEGHAIGLIHRDIKPSNVMVCERGGRYDVAKLLDFGLVRVPTWAQGEGSTLTQVGTLAGTPAYMAPEQAAGKVDMAGRSDLYSLGAVAYFLLTSRPPFVRQTAVQTLAAHLSEAVVPPGQLRPEVPADLEELVLRCLEKDPARRFPDAVVLEQALAQCVCAGDWSGTAAVAWWGQCAVRVTPP
jgi:serine/threonine-protein kinase